jgi:hypothetical protein
MVVSAGFVVGEVVSVGVGFVVVGDINVHPANMAAKTNKEMVTENTLNQAIIHLYPQ